ncbi:uncharacterized protein LOC125514545 isoform X1 [Triticum urartu]|uniref:uncharacterized protein LOC125514545 isoform X1 n=1 Tax=Triticum urartu TaxID=4572 RepID=UPI0020430DC2|nr:uncharacterized protein LOC125514545 isoform X1 [Triticum urartu]
MERAVGELAAEDGRGGANSLLPAPHHVPSFLLSDRTESVLQRDPATRGGAATGDAAGEAGEVPPEVRLRSSRTSPSTAATGGTFAAGFHMNNFSKLSEEKQ